MFGFDAWNTSYLGRVSDYRSLGIGCWELISFSFFFSLWEGWVCLGLLGIFLMIYWYGGVAREFSRFFSSDSTNNLDRFFCHFTFSNLYLFSTFRSPVICHFSDRCIYLQGGPQGTMLLELAFACFIVETLTV